MKTDQSFTFGKTTRKNLDNYFSSSKKWQEFCQGKEVIKEFIASFNSEEDQAALEYWYNHYVYLDNEFCWSRKSPTGVIGEKMSESNRKRVAKGTHNLLGPETNRKRIEDGTHHLLGGEISRETQRKRVENATHNFLGGEIQRKTQRKRVENGTHHLLGGEIQRKQLAQGTHPTQIKKVCQHCGKEVASTMYGTWHGNKCKLNPNKEQ